MTDTINGVAVEPEEQELAVPAVDEQGIAEQLVAQAREKGIELVGPNGLLSQLTKRVLETALEAEMSEHLGYDKHHPAGRNHGNSRNGVRSKTVLSGRVSNINKPSDVAGVYAAAGAGLAVGKGVRAIVLTNPKGAVLELSGKQVGLMANADLSGLAITMK